jgi:hypothetical protein
MKKSFLRLIVVILLALLAVAAFLFKSKSKLTTVDKDSRNFSFKDTAAITKIFIADKEGDQSELVRTKNGWIVNDKYSCRSEAILNLLEVIKNVEVKMSVPKEAKRNVIKRMSSRALKVELYTAEGLVKQFYVGHETDESDASYMLLTNIESGENYDDPYACFIPGFVGYLQPRFIAKEGEWRDRIVINYSPPQLKEISVKNFDYPQDSSFTIELVDAKTFKLKNYQGAEIPFDDAKMKQYLVYFQNISYEVLLTSRSKKLQDSLSAQKSFFEISITTAKFTTETYKFYRKGFNGETNPDLKVKYKFDPDRMYLRFAQDKEWALCQYYVFGKLFMGRNYFSIQTPVKK